MHYYPDYCTDEKVGWSVMCGTHQLLITCRHVCLDGNFLKKKTTERKMGFKYKNHKNCTLFCFFSEVMIYKWENFSLKNTLHLLQSSFYGLLGPTFDRRSTSHTLFTPCFGMRCNFALIEPTQLIRLSQENLQFKMALKNQGITII